MWVSGNTKDVDERMLASMMVGREMLFAELEKFGWVGRPLIQTEDLHVLSDRMPPAVHRPFLQIKTRPLTGRVEFCFIKAGL